MTLPKELTIVESPKTMVKGESRAYQVDFSSLGTPAAAGDTKAYYQDGTDVSAQLSGVASLAGNIVTFELLTPTASGWYRLMHTVSIGGQACIGVLDIAVFDVQPPTSPSGIAASSYGSLVGVAALVPRYANRSGDWNDTTRPARTTVVNLIDQVSSAVNTILAQNGFSVPITTTTIKPTLDLWVNQEVAAVVEGINGSGRFGPTTKQGGGKGRFALIYEDVQLFIEANATGFERMGAPRPYVEASGIGYRGTDESGEDIFPIRQRDEFGTSWDNWGG